MRSEGARPWFPAWFSWDGVCEFVLVALRRVGAEFLLRLARLYIGRKVPEMRKRIQAFGCLAVLAGVVGLWCGAAVGAPRAEDPFFPDVEFRVEEGQGRVWVTFAMMDKALHIYDDMMMCSLGEAVVKPAFSSKDADGRVIYEGYSEFAWSAEPGVTFTLAYQGCDEGQCYMPQEVTFSVTPEGAVVEGELEAPAGVAPVAVPNVVVVPEGPMIEAPVAAGVESAAAVAPTASLAEPAAVAGDVERAVSGFVEVGDFVSFLRGQAADGVNAEGAVSFLDDPKAWVAEHGIWLLIVVVFIGGLALNLTPCVLPMMPINLAIIGAGAAGGSRLRGALRGGAYGLGIALAYGILALIPVLTGAAFGAIQSAWWFNAVIAVVFVLLALALFDVFMIDFTRFSGSGSGKQGAIAAFVAGAVSAVLAGACVAPVLIAVLLLTADYVAAEQYWALCLPFVLGLGMALPWPVAGAGLSFLPKPGAWMVWVKKVFGVVVLLFAAHYGWVAVKACLPSEGLDGADLPAIERAIAKARAEGKPVFLDFWGTACKVCDKMEATTLAAPEVQAELSRFTVLKVRMDLANRAIRSTQERFQIKGLPTYVVIEQGR